MLREKVQQIKFAMLSLFGMLMKLEKSNLILKSGYSLTALRSVEVVHFAIQRAAATIPQCA